MLRISDHDPCLLSEDCIFPPFPTSRRDVRQVLLLGRCPMNIRSAFATMDLNVVGALIIALCTWDAARAQINPTTAPDASMNEPRPAGPSR